MLKLDLLSYHRQIENCTICIKQLSSGIREQVTGLWSPKGGNKQRNISNHLPFCLKTFSGHWGKYSYWHGTPWSFWIRQKFSFWTAEVCSIYGAEYQTGEKSSEKDIQRSTFSLNLLLKMKLHVFRMKLHEWARMT